MDADARTTALRDLVGDGFDSPLPEFRPSTRYNPHLDWIVRLDQDVGYVSKTIYDGLELLLHPQTGEPVGFKILGAKALFDEAFADSR